MSTPNFCVEPYIKEKNILQLSLFYFGKKKRKTKTEVEWSDKNGEYSLKCNSAEYGVPGSLEQDVYTACMRIWVSQGMPRGGIYLNYLDIAKELKIAKPRGKTTEIKKSLLKLGSATYELWQCFVKADENGNRKIDTVFHLFDTVELFSKTKGKSNRFSRSRLVFPKIIQENLEKKYYQYLDMAWYRALPQGLPRRLYEYLEKRRYHSANGMFSISEKFICQWLPITDKNTTTRRKTMKKIAQSLIDKGYLLTYDFDKTKKLCRYKYSQKKAPGAEVAEEKVIDAKPSQPEANIEELMSLMKLKRISPKLRKTIIKYATTEGIDYVRTNIEYANEKAKRSYGGYLTGALKDDYGWEKRQKQQKKTRDDSVEKAVLAAIEAAGGTGKAKYQERRILFITPAGPAVEVEGENPVVSPWDDINPAEIT